MGRCEVCETRRQPLITCGSLDEPMLDFCSVHYIEHVREAHEGEALPGCRPIDEVQNLCAAGFW